MFVFSELKQLNREELESLLLKEKDKLRDLRFRVASRELKKMNEVSQTRKKIARISTLLKS